MKNLLGWVAFLAASGVAAIAVARTNTLRIVTYNIEADTPGIETPAWTTPRPGLIQPADSSGNATGTTSDGGVLEGFGELPVGASNNFQALDILLLQETTSNTTTIDPIVSALNTYYGTPGKYAQSPYQGTQNGSNGFGNGPNALVYNTQKLDLIASVGVGTPMGSGNGEYRQVIRYQFRPDGGTSADDFYIYVSHYKAGTGATNENHRLGEATIIRNDAASLPSGSRIIYTGDYNVRTSTEAAYQKILSTSQINAGVDPLNLSGVTGVDWTANSNNQYKTESATSLFARFDYMLMTSNLNPSDVFTPASFNSTSTGLQLIPNTHQTFGNNGTTSFQGATDSAGNTSLNNVVQNGGTFISATTLKNDLEFASDHLPVMADFSLGPGTSIWNGGGSSSNWNTAQDWDSAPLDGDALQFAGSTRLSNSNNFLSVVGGITFNSGAGAFTLSGNAVTNLGGITNNSTNLQTVSLNQTLGAAQSIIAASGNITVGGTIANGGNLLTVGGSNTTTLGTTVSGSGGLAKTGSGTLVLNATNNYSGGNTIAAGTVQLGNTNGLGSLLAILTVNGGTLDLHGFSATVGSLNGTGSTILSNVVSPSAKFTVGNGGGSGSYGGTIANGTGIVSLVKTGAGTQILSGFNSYSGGTTVAGGTLQLGNASGLGSTTGAVTVNSGATLDVHGTAPTIGTLAGAGAVQSNAAQPVTLTVGNGGGTSAFSGTVANGSGTLAIQKTGLGTLTLSGNNSYSGGTILIGGSLQLGHVNALGANTGALTVNNGSTVDLHGFSPTIGALGGVVGSIQTNVAGAVSLTVGNGGGTGSYSGSIINGTGTVSLIKTGAGTQTLSGNNSYTGGTTVNTGTLVAGNKNALGTGALRINNTALTQLQAGLTGPVQLPSLTIAGGVTPTATLDITDNNLIVHNGNLATMTAQVKSGFNINGTLWAGTGITSSTAAFDAANFAGDKAVGMIINDDGFGTTIYDNWPSGADSGGQVSVVNTDVLVKYTYYGDANLDGVTDASTDFSLWATGNSDPSSTGWLFGDFDYSGTVDGATDYALWATGNAAVDGPLGGGVQPVPEPSTLLLAALGFLGLAAWQRHRSRT